MSVVVALWRMLKRTNIGSECSLTVDQQERKKEMESERKGRKNKERVKWRSSCEKSRPVVQAVAGSKLK